MPEQPAGKTYTKDRGIILINIALTLFVMNKKEARL
jgi:hypothetical protein